VKAIIFGINGQDGFYLSQLLIKNKVEVIGVSRSESEWTMGDIGNFAFVEALVKKYKPEYIFHFAALSTTQHSALFENHNAISTGTLNVLEAVKNHSPNSRVFLSGSAMQFKNEGLPINEQTSFEASSNYSVARIQSVYAARYYRDRFRLKVYVGYFFNHDSPLRTDHHVNKMIVSAVKRIAMGSTERLELGNMNVCKEFSFAGDIVKAVWRLVNQDTIFETVIGSGKAYSIKEWTELCFQKINRNWENFVEVKSHFTPEYLMLVSDPSLVKGIGWEPEVDFYQMVEMMMKSDSNN
jgi:GDPmannose 4,6-dehydratase